MKRLLKYLTVSEAGMIRSDNQDSVFVSDKSSVFCVADGMGGGSAGALASFIVCEELRASFKKCPHGGKNLVNEAVSAASKRIKEHAMNNCYAQMGSTVALLAFDAESGGKADIGYIGDSRVYRMRNGDAELLTDDHTLVNQILQSADGESMVELNTRRSPLSHILTRVVGVKDVVLPEWRSVDVQLGDWFLVCTDGVHDVINLKRMSELLKQVCSIEEFSSHIKTEIYKCGAPDNLTYCIVEVVDVI